MSGKVISNLGQLAEGIGSYLGMMEGLDQQTYMDGLLERAYVDVSASFNKAAAAAAMSDKSLAHMWEFGTAGISRGNTKYANPTNPAAMLWVNTMTGQGRMKTISFIFKPAKSFVPPHTEADTGVAQSVLDRLKVNTGERKYKFPNKAFVFESGMDVNVVAKRSKRLFIPIDTEGTPSDIGNQDVSKGYVWARSHTYAPGDFADSVGRFTGFFGGWWAAQGASQMFEQMSMQVEKDLTEIDKTIRSSKGKMVSPAATNIDALVKRGERKTRKQFTLKVGHEANERADVIL